MTDKTPSEHLRAAADNVDDALDELDKAQGKETEQASRHVIESFADVCESMEETMRKAAINIEIREEANNES